LFVFLRQVRETLVDIFEQFPKFFFEPLYQRVNRTATVFPIFSYTLGEIVSGFFAGRGSQEQPKECSDSHPQRQSQQRERG
jgi:hypothetical protein